MKVLIIGASGLVGGNCMRYFKEISDWEIVGTYFSYQAEDTVFFDTLNPDSEGSFDADSYGPDVIVHCGALTHVDYCEDHEEESYEKTVGSTAKVIELSRRHDAKVVFISTDYVFDGKDGPYDESAIPNALSVYGSHKLAAEEMILNKTDNHLILRVTNIYGDEERGKNFVARILDQIWQGKHLTLRLPIDQYATPINAHDIARATYLLLRDRKRGIYNLGGTDYMNRVQLCLNILKYYPEAQYTMEPTLTRDLNQKAARPLQGGLKSAKFLGEYPEFRFTTVDDYMIKKKKDKRLL